MFSIVIPINQLTVCYYAENSALLEMSAIMPYVEIIKDIFSTRTNNIYLTVPFLFKSACKPHYVLVGI